MYWEYSRSETLCLQWSISSRHQMTLVWICLIPAWVVLILAHYPGLLSPRLRLLPETTPRCVRKALSHGALPSHETQTSPDVAARRIHAGDKPAAVPTAPRKQKKDATGVHKASGRYCCYYLRFWYVGVRTNGVDGINMAHQCLVRLQTYWSSL